MRTTLTLDPDVAERLNAEMARTDRALKRVVNDALRKGLQLPATGTKPAPYKVTPLKLVFRPGVDSGKLNALADELEDEVLVKKLRA